MTATHAIALAAMIPLPVEISYTVKSLWLRMLLATMGCRCQCQLPMLIEVARVSAMSGRRRHDLGKMLFSEYR